MDERDHEPLQKVPGYFRDIETQLKLPFDLDEKGMRVIEFEKGLRVISGVPVGSKFFFLQAVLIEARWDISLSLMGQALLTESIFEPYFRINSQGNSPMPQQNFPGNSQTEI